jgi:hypothetical protein
VHAPSDASVVPVDADPEERAAAAAAVLAGMTALLHASPFAAPPAIAHVLRPADPWRPRSGFSLPLRRPPRG